MRPRFFQCFSGLFLARLDARVMFPSPMLLVTVFVQCAGEKHLLCVPVVEQWLLLLHHLLSTSRVIQFGVGESDVKRVAIKVKPYLAPIKAFTPP
jgi:hypothetical protein